MAETGQRDQWGYDPARFRALCFHEAVAGFADGADSPRAWLERCLAAVEAREPVVQAFVTRNDDDARAAADASAARWRAGRPLSPIDGMPVGIKDLLETRDMPTQMGCAAYAGNFPRNDNAAVRALRQAGAVVFGKLVTAELGGSHPGPTTNPFDPARTPGGSSSGSAAAVAAGMMPAAIGSQVGGSIIRPAGFCGNFALKPSQGGLHRGERQATSMSTHGPHAGSIEDMWQVAIEIASRTGGDPGRPGLAGPPHPPAPQRPDRLIVLETAGWAGLDEASREAWDRLTAAIAATGIALVRRTDHPLVEGLERAVADAAHIAAMITAWENRWHLRNLMDRDPDGLSVRIKQTLAEAEAMTAADYRALLLRRAAARHAHAALAGMADAAITLSCPGPAPLWSGDLPGRPLLPRPTGDAVFNYPSSMLGAPVVSVPLMAVGGLPVGLSVMGQPQEDARVTAIARFLHRAVAPVSVG